MKISLYNLFIYILKILGIIFILGYISSILFLIRQRDRNGRPITISILLDAIGFMIWIILLLLSGVPLKEIFK